MFLLDMASFQPSETTLLVVAVVFLFISIYAFKSMFNGYSPKRERNKCESPIELTLFDALVKNGYKVYAQVPCGNYRIDLVVYGKGQKIAIEADGKAFHSSREQVKHDKEKDWHLRKNGWEVVRFSGSEIFRNKTKCVLAIKNLMK